MSEVFKRSQVALAVWRTIDHGHLSSEEVPPTVQNTMRRLIDVDRQMDADPRAYEAWKRHYAFVGGEPQGRGSESLYRLEEVVALWLGVELLAAGLPQSETIRFIRALKPHLESAVGRIIKSYREDLKDAETDGPLQRRIMEAKFVPMADSVYVVTEHVDHHGVHGILGKGESICRGPDGLMGFIGRYQSRTPRFVIVEIANATLALAWLLPRQEARKRGRPA